MQARQAEKLHKDLVRVLKGVEQGIVEVPTENKAFLLKLNDKIGTTINQITASYLQPLVLQIVGNP